MQSDTISKILDLIKNNRLIAFFLIYVFSVGSSILIMNHLKEEKAKITICSNDEPSGPDEVIDSPYIYAEISGAVVSPGVYKLSRGGRLVDLVKMAQGFSEQASEEWLTKAVNLSVVLKDSQKIYIPFKWDTYDEVEKFEPIPLVKELVAASVSEETTSSTSENTSGVSQGSGEEKTNVNIATLDSLDALPGIGPTYAQKIIDNRPYKDYTELKSKSGVVVSTLEKIKDLISF